MYKQDYKNMSVKPISMLVVMNSDTYLCMTIPTIKRHDLDGCEKITTFRLCSCRDLKHLYVHQQLGHVLILLLLQ